MGMSDHLLSWLIVICKYAASYQNSFGSTEEGVQFQLQFAESQKKRFLLFLRICITNL